jgi:dihydroxyacetone kinase-like protein
MIDALKPAADYAAEHKDEPLSDVVESCSREARAGSEATKEMKAAFGRMRTLGERTLGHPDPGSITMYLILEQMSTFIKGL